MNYPVGSTWNKWDLHVHTPNSIVQSYGSASEPVWEEFIRQLEALPSEFKVLGINDYIFVDGYERVRNAKRVQGRLRNIDLVLPVIELRLDKFAGVVTKDADGHYSRSDWNRLNLHVIFDELEPELIRQQFLNALAPCYDLIPDSTHLRGRWQAVITPESLAQLGTMVIDAAPPEKKDAYAGPLQEGFNNLCVSLDSIRKSLDRHPLSDRYLLAIGKTEWANMKWTDHSIAEKRNLINSVDIVFTAAHSPEAYVSARTALVAANVQSRLLDCSDAHHWSNSVEKDRLANCFTWVKADTSFAGLRQAIREFEGRVFVGDLPPKLRLVSANRTKYASRIKITKKASSKLPDEWFAVDLPLNHDLVSIVGNKGSGKSALADALALAGNTRNCARFSFLSEDRFRDPKVNPAAHFVVTLQWADETFQSADLDKNPTSDAVERVKYLPQSYLEALCNELGGGGSTSFDSELRNIIYTHVPEELRLGCSSLDELLGLKVAEIDNLRSEAIAKLRSLNQRICEVEERLSPDFRRSLESQLNAKVAELRALEISQPVLAEDPATPEDDAIKAAAAAERVNALERALDDVLAEEQAAREQRALLARNSAMVNRAAETVRGCERSYATALADLQNVLNTVAPGVQASAVMALHVDASVLDELSASYAARIKAEDEVLSATGGGSLSPNPTKVRSVKV